jgi:hypothetical protein
MKDVQGTWSLQKLVSLAMLLLTASFTCNAPAKAADQSSTGDNWAAISPDGRWFLASYNDGGTGMWLGRIDHKTYSKPQRISGLASTPFFILSPRSLDSTKYLALKQNRRGFDLVVCHVFDRTRTELRTGLTQLACFSPDGNRVAALTFKLKSAKLELSVWNLSGQTPIAAKHYSFRADDIEGFTWLNDHELFVFTPHGYNPDFEMQSFYIVDCDSHSITSLPYRVTTKVGITWPYLDRSKQILALAGSKRLFAEGRKTHYRKYIEINPRTGAVTDLFKLTDWHNHAWTPLFCGDLTWVTINGFDSGIGSVLTRSIDSVTGAVGPIVKWNLGGVASVDSKGRVFGIVGTQPKYASVVK